MLMLLVFEGIDGSGKGAQIKMLAEYLKQHRIGYRLHKYPTKKAKEAFAHLSGKANVPAQKLADVFANDIMQEQAKVDKEIKEGLVVICDRYLHSTLAYQGAEIGYAKLKKKIGALGAKSADLVVLLDIPPTVAKKRKSMQRKPDRHEKDLEFLHFVRKNYLRMAREGFLSYNWAVIRGDRPREEVFANVLAHIEPLLTKKIA
ncbi:MAG: dTMP kinase [Candidatus Micrarchaeota archaeon]|nr:dTMP kinase [Candidatus Micrarchaeota archaeon]